MKHELRSSGASVLAIKYWVPLVCVGGALGVFGHDFPTLRFLPALPLLLLAAFLASLAVVEEAGGVIRYRRLFKWRELRREDILSAKVVWQPFIGSIQLRKPILPWGRLYFVLDKNTESNPFRRGEFRIVRYLNEDLLRGNHPSVTPAGTRSANVKTLLAASIGILACLMILYLTPSDLLRTIPPRPNTNVPMLLNLLFKLLEWLHMWPVQVAGLVTITFLAVKKRNAAEAWLYGFLSGFALTAILGRRWS
jgi:hypothetical protein